MSTLSLWVGAQAADRMDVLQLALDGRRGAYADAAAVEQLAALLGLSGRGAEARRASQPSRVPCHELGCMPCGRRGRGVQGLCPSERAHCLLCRALSPWAVEKARKLAHACAAA